MIDLVKTHLTHPWGILYVIVFIIVLCQRWCGVDDCVVLDVEGAGL